MKTYARIRKIENPTIFKDLINMTFSAEYPGDFQVIKEWKDFGLDGYIKSTQTAYAVYCPLYPERREQSQYKKKILSDLTKLNKAIKEGKISFPIKRWIFVTPEELSTEIIDDINKNAKKFGLDGSGLGAQGIAPIFMKHTEIHPDFPEIASGGLGDDKVPSLSIRLVNNKGYTNLEVFNNGTEDIEDIEVAISADKITWRDCKNFFLYEFDNPVMASPHTCVNLKKGERQYMINAPATGGFTYKISGVGVESKKTYTDEAFIPVKDKVN